MEETSRDDLVLFEELFKQHYQLLAAKSFEICRNWQVAEDAVQDFFADVWLKKSWRQVLTGFAPYAVRAVQYKTISLLRKSGSRMEHHLEAAQLQEGVARPDAGVHEDQLHRELKLIEALNTLPAQRKEAFLMAHHHNLSYAEISTRMGISINTVKTHLRLAMSQLREILLIFFLLIIF